MLNCSGMGWMWRVCYPIRTCANSSIGLRKRTQILRHPHQKSSADRGCLDMHAIIGRSRRRGQRTLSLPAKSHHGAIWKPGFHGVLPFGGIAEPTPCQSAGQCFGASPVGPRTAILHCSLLYYWGRRHFGQTIFMSERVKEKRYRDRDGTAEAQADAKTRTPWKLYAHVFDGRAPGFVTPGLKNCDPRVGSPDHYTPLLEADWSQRVASSETDWEVAEEATLFAAAYNREIFRSRGDEVKAVHPDAELS
jgi:hypothetical protein